MANRLLLRELVVFREEMFQHLQQEWSDILTRASSLWSPRSRNSKESNLSQQDMSSKSSAATSSDKATVIVEEEALTQLWIPGRIIHIYRHRGRYCASEVSRDFSELRTIAMQGNIFDDHRCEKIFNALLELRAVRRASMAAPAWVPFNACIQLAERGYDALAATMSSAGTPPSPVRHKTSGTSSIAGTAADSFADHAPPSHALCHSTDSCFRRGFVINAFTKGTSRLVFEEALMYCMYVNG